MQFRTKIRTDISVISGNRLVHNQVSSRDCFASVISNDSLTNNNTAYQSTHTSTNHMQQKKEPLRYIHHYPKQVISNFGKNEQQNSNQARSVYYPLSLPSSEMNIGSQFNDIEKAPTTKNQANNQKNISNQVRFQEQKKVENVISSFSRGKLKIVRIDSFEAQGDEENDKIVSETNSKEHQKQKSQINMTEQSSHNVKAQNESFVKRVYYLQGKIKAQDQILFQNQKQLINLQDTVQKMQDSLRINRTIIFNLNQKISYLEKKHQNTLKDNEKNYAENLKKQSQILRESIFQEQKAKNNQFVQSLQRDNNEFRQKLINEVKNKNQFRNRQQLERQKQKSQFFKTLATKDQQIKIILQQKQKEVLQITKYFEQKNDQNKLQIEKLEVQLKNLDEQNIRLDQQNIRFFEGNQHLVKQIETLNSDIAKFYKEREDFVLEQSDKNSQIIELNISRNNALLEIFELKDIINTFRSTNDGQINFRDEKNIKLERKEDINNKNGIQISQKHQNKAILQIKTQQISKLQQQLKNCIQQLQDKICQLQLQQNINVKKQKQIKRLQTQVCELKLQISLSKSENILKEKLFNQKIKQFQSKQKNLSDLENQYRQVLEDELKNIEMIDEDYNQNQQIFSKDHSRNQSSMPKQYYKAKHSSDSQEGDEQQEKEKLERKIKQLIYINKSMSAKIEQINQKSNCKQFKELKQRLERSEDQKENLEKNFIEVNIMLRKLANKCAFYQSKIQQLQQNIEKLEIMLEDSTDDLMKSGLRLMELKFAQKMAKQVQQQNRLYKSNSQILKKQSVDKYIPFKVMQQSNRLKNTPYINKQASSKHSRKQETNYNAPFDNIINQNKFQSNISIPSVRTEQKNKNTSKRTQQKSQKQSQLVSMDARQLSQILPREKNNSFKFKQKSKLTDYFLQKKSSNPVFNRFGYLPLQKQSKNSENKNQKDNLFEYLAQKTAIATQQSQSYRNFLDRELKKMRD